MSSAARDLFAAAFDCLMTDDPVAKCAKTAACAAAFAAGRLQPGCGDQVPMRAIAVPGRPARPLLVEPRQLPQRGFGSAAGRAAFIHAVAHIEFNAINLAWDAVYRFRDMPAEFYADWVGVAADEARHFELLQQRLAAHDHRYGDFDAHNGLWEMAERTAHDCLQRMALVPRVLEARGLDVTPPMIERLRRAGDDETAAVLEIILREEVAHVAAGSRWFRYCCKQQGCEPTSTFETLLNHYGRGVLRQPFNVPARQQAGFDQDDLDLLQRLTEGTQ